MFTEYYPNLDSTKELAEEYIFSQKYDDHFLIIAETQNKGKGRKGNEWQSPMGGLWFSLGLKHVSKQMSFTLFVGYCVLKALNDIFFEEKKEHVAFLPDVDKWYHGGELRSPLLDEEMDIATAISGNDATGKSYTSAGHSACTAQKKEGMKRNVPHTTFQIKWPNDIYLHGKKICGLICAQYAQYGFTNIGIGINTNIPVMPENVLPNSGSILSLLQIKINNQIYLSAILNNIFERLLHFEERGLSIFYDYYRQHDFLDQKYLNIFSGNDFYHGFYHGIDADGGLYLKENNGNIKTIYSGRLTIDNGQCG